MVRSVRQPKTVVSPRVIVEVLTASTEAHDRGEKLSGCMLPLEDVVY